MRVVLLLTLKKKEWKSDTIVIVQQHPSSETRGQVVGQISGAEGELADRNLPWVSEED